MTRRVARCARWLGTGGAALVLVAWPTKAVAQTPVDQPPTPSGPLTAEAEEPVDDAVNTCDDTVRPVNPSAIVPDDCWGRLPSSHYDIGCDEGAWNHISRKVYCALTDLAFQGARSTTALALWLVEWAFGFGVYERLGDPMIAVAENYRANLIGPLGLEHVAWTYAICWAAIMGLRGRLALAGGELAMSVVLAGLAGLLLANPAGYLTGAFDTMGTLSGAFLAAANGQAPPDGGSAGDAMVAPLQAEIHAAFVEAPYDSLNWGGELTGRCAHLRDQILATGPHGNSDEPRNVMSLGGCPDQAAFNHEPSGQRVFGAALTLLAALVMTVLVALIAVTIVIAQVVAVALFAVAPLAALGAILPGGGRELAWRWLAALVRVGLVVVGMSFVLSLLLLAVQALLAADAEGSLIERFLLVNLVVVAMFIARKRIVSAGAQLAGRLGGRLSSRRADGERASAWLGSAAVGGVSGFAIGSSLGLDPRGRTGRLVSFAARDYMAERRLRRHYRRSERRSQRPVVRERTEVSSDGDDEVIERHTITVDGPAVAPGLNDSVRRYVPTRSARARRARARVEAHARRRAAELPAYRPPSRFGWTVPPPPPDDGFDGPIDPEEA